MDIFQLFNLTISVTLLPARRPLMMVELIFSSKVMFLRITVYCYVDIEDDTIGYRWVQFYNRKNDI